MVIFRALKQAACRGAGHVMEPHSNLCQLLAEIVLCGSIMHGLFHLENTDQHPSM